MIVLPVGIMENKKKLKLQLQLPVVFFNYFYTNVPQFPQEHCFLEGSQALPICQSGKSRM